MAIMLPGEAAADQIRCNTIVKRYPDGRARIMVADRAIFRRPGYEERGERRRAAAPCCEAVDGPEARAEAEYAQAERLGIEGDGGPTAAEQKRSADNLARAQRRARAAVRDLALANPFKYFVTLTFDRRKVDRWNDAEVLRVTRNWLDNRVRRNGLAYVLVAERHKDGAIHFHGFFNGAVEGHDSGHRTQRGQIVYNLPGWSWGFTTAVEIDGAYEATVSYVCKYVTKGSEKVGGRWYYHGGNLRLPEVEYLDSDYEALSQISDSKGHKSYKCSIDALGCDIAFIETEAVT